MAKQAHDMFTTRVQFVGASWLLYRIQQAADLTGRKSIADYARRAVLEALARDLGHDLAEMEAEQPPTRAVRSGVISGETAEKVR
jgi:hypothetical protein